MQAALQSIPVRSTARLQPQLIALVTAKGAETALPKDVRLTLLSQASPLLADLALKLNADLADLVQRSKQKPLDRRRLAVLTICWSWLAAMRKLPDDSSVSGLLTESPLSHHQSAPLNLGRRLMLVYWQLWAESWLSHESLAEHAEA